LPLRKRIEQNNQFFQKLSLLDVSQHAALLDLFDALQCNATVCPRFARSEPCPAVVSCTSDSNFNNGRVVSELNLHGRGLSGSVSSAIAALSTVRVVNLNDNALTGSIPDLSALTAITDLLWHKNRLTGTLPSTLALLSQLRRLTFDQNNITSTIPAEFERLTSLELFNGFENQLVGTVPNLAPSLKSLWLARNNLSGSLPSSISQMKSLTLLAVDQNPLLSGTLPDLSSLTALDKLIVYETRLSGIVPSLPLLTVCTLDGACFNCSSVPTLCSCRAAAPEICNPPPITLPLANTSSSLASPTTTARASLSSTTAALVVTAGSVASSLEPEPSNAIAIGAGVGGGIALLLLVALVVFLVWRKRKAPARAVAVSPLQPHYQPPAPAASNSAYGSVANAVPLNAMGDDYDLGGIPVIPPNVPGNYGVAGLQEHGEYESGRL
jgi:hypothetical protein